MRLEKNIAESQGPKGFGEVAQRPHLFSFTAPGARRPLRGHQACVVILCDAACLHLFCNLHRGRSQLLNRERPDISIAAALQPAARCLVTCSLAARKLHLAAFQLAHHGVGGVRGAPSQTTFTKRMCCHRGGVWPPLGVATILDFSMCMCAHYPLSRAGDVQTGMQEEEVFRGSDCSFFEGSDPLGRAGDVQTGKHQEKGLQGIRLKAFRLHSMVNGPPK